MKLNKKQKEKAKIGHLLKDYKFQLEFRTLKQTRNGFISYIFILLIDVIHTKNSLVDQLDMLINDTTMTCKF